MVKIIFEPHATTTDNEAKLASGWNDVDLSELGVSQCIDLRDRSLDRGLDAIFVSDTQRAVKTAVPTAEKLKIPVYVDCRLRECDYGELTQKAKNEVDDQKDQRLNVPFPGGESYEQCMARMGEFLEDLAAGYDGETVMIIGHRATQYGLEHHINGKSLLKCVTDPWAWQPGWTYELKA